MCSPQSIRQDPPCLYTPKRRTHIIPTHPRPTSVNPHTRCAQTGEDGRSKHGNAESQMASASAAPRRAQLDRMPNDTARQRFRHIYESEVEI